VVDLTAVTTVASGNAEFVSDAWSSNVTDVVSAAKDGNNASYTSTAKFSSMTEGTFYATYTITLRRGASDNEATNADQSEIIVEDTTIIVPIVVECPAAPAIAARLLREHNVSGKTFGAYVSKVAHEMGSSPADENGSWFHGINKSITVNGVDTPNSEYEEAVDAYLKDIGAYK